ncbi:thiol reductant ABC exporter subunit CydC [Billgrantia gudaonensis]|uniref:ATP-binding cassette, subfamily C, CydC n=1 Tax=Billgrantia gudaonensis TaxID=376427 RepID=A0A1G8Z597_9GAMM|nr:thiol reductant ABC exporter subunit CydC [Halomonas gudaonensis]SDK10133.1 ATP-binding cassette, subfamily C, CydC [Halomonas gudaonensis]
MSELKSAPAIRLRDLLRLRRGGWSLAFVIGAATLLAVVALLAISGWFITAAAAAGVASMALLGFDYFRPAALIRLCAIVRTVGRYGERLASHHAALGLLKDLRCRLFDALGRRTPGAAQISTATGSAATMHRLVTDIDQLDRFVLSALLPWGWAGLLSLAVMGALAWLDPTLLLAAMPGLLMAWLGLPLLTLWQGSRLARYDAELGEARREALVEPLAAITPLLLWGRWGDVHRRVAEHDRRCLDHQERQRRLASLVGALQQVALGMSIVSVLWWGVSRLSESGLSVALLLAVVMVLLGLGEILAPLAVSFVSLGASLAARDRLNALVADPRGVSASTPAVAGTPSSPLSLELDGISARIPGALNGPEGVSLKLRAGEVLCVRGPSGCGKSTLLQVLAGELAPSAGECRLNDRKLNEWRLNEVIGYLPQQWDLFDMSLAANLRLGNGEASDDMLWQMLDELALGEWVRRLPQGLDTPLGEYGAAVSGGQARRIALARLLLARRPLLLLDEPLVGLDAVCHERVLAAVRRRQGDGPLVVVSHVPLDLPGLRLRELWLSAEGRPVKAGGTRASQR